MYFKTFVILLLVGFALAKNLKHKKREVLASTASDNLGSLTTMVQDVIAFLNSIPSQLASGINPSTIASTLLERLEALLTAVDAVPILGNLVDTPIQNAIDILKNAIENGDNAQITQVLNTLIPDLSRLLGLLSSLLGPLGGLSNGGGLAIKQ